MADDELDDEDEDEDESAEGDGEDDEDGKGSSGSGTKKKLFIIVGAVILLVIGGIGGAYVAGLLDPIIEAIAGGEPGEGDESASVAVFYDLPELTVNLNTVGRKSTFLKIRVSLELQKQEDIPKVEEMMPRIIDNFQVYLRELRIEDLKGSAGMYRLREELLTRVAAAAAPARVNDVLFKEMLIQ